jgi:hemolysin III
VPAAADPTFRKDRTLFDRLREPVNGLTHLVAAVVALVGVIVLGLRAQDDPATLVTLLLYGVTLVLMFAASASYHLIRAGPRRALFLRKLDHTAIYLLIAGTYTPICSYFFTGFWRSGFLAIIWGLAVVGIVSKLFVINAPRWFSSAAYLGMGWLSVLGSGEILDKLPTGALLWLVLGGFFFTLGAVVYIIKKPDPWPGLFGFHEIWHVFVILGAFSHYALMLGYVA